MVMLDEFQKCFKQIYNSYENKTISSAECIKYINSLKQAWDCSRLDLKNMGNESNSIQILENNKELSITFPDWFKNNRGQGCKIETKSTHINLKIKCILDGELYVILRGMDFRVLNNNPMHIFINFTKLLINDNIIFDEEKLIWHNEPFEFKEFYKNEDIIKLDVEFKRIFDYYPQLKFHLNNIGDESDLKASYSIINNYITYEKILIQLKDVEKNIYEALSNL